MSRADSVSVFAEGTFEEQIIELVAYISRAKPEAERPAFVQRYEEELKVQGDMKAPGSDVERRRHIFSDVVASIDGLGDGQDREIEGFFNLVFSHLFTLYPSSSPEATKLVEHLLRVVRGHSGDHVFIIFRVLGNLFNAIPRRSPLRLLVCKALLSFASEKDELDSLQITPADVCRWFDEWEASAEEKTELLKAIAEAYTSVNRLETAFKFQQLYVRSIPSTSPVAQKAALELIASALRLPNTFDSDALLQLENVRSLGSQPLFYLIQLLTAKSIPDYRSWLASHESVLGEFGLDNSTIERKLRVLILADVGFKNIGKDVPYADIASALEIDTSEVEKWVIDVIRAGLISGKLSQTTQTFHVTRSSPRSFSHEQWQFLESRLLTWRTGLLGIQSVLVSARDNERSSDLEKGLVVAEQAA